MKRNLAQQAEDAEQLLRLRFSFFWQFWGGDVAGAVTWPYVSFECKSDLPGQKTPGLKLF